MSTYNLRRFAQPDILKHIKPDNLISFLKRYEDYLLGRGFSFDLNEDGELDFKSLSKILLEPSDDIDISFVEALFFIQEMSDDEHFEHMNELAEANNVDTHDTSTPADLALALWLHNPELLKRPHAEILLLKPKSFMYFLSKHPAPEQFDVPNQSILQALEKEMDDWFSKNKRGNGCRILAVSASEEDKVYFMIHHGMPFKREGKIESGKSQTIFYRPEFHDVLIYDRFSNELAIFNKSGAKKERVMYLDLFSQHLFGQSDYFPSDDKYTLKPLLNDGENALACADIPHLEEVKLVEIQLQFRGAYNDRQTYRSNDLFASLKSRERSLPTFGDLVSASFSVKFENAKRARTIKIRTPNIANFDRKEDSHLIELWLRNRGFVKMADQESLSEEQLEPNEGISIAAMA